MKAVTGHPLMLVTQATTNLEKCKAMNELHQLHAQIIKTNLLTNTIVLRNLVSSYSLHGGLDHAISVFHGTRNPDPFLYFTLIKALSESSKPLESLYLYAHMLCCLEDLEGVEFSLPSVLKVCGRLKALNVGKQFHAQILKTRFLFDPFVANSVIRMYSEAGEVQLARKVFDEMPERDLVSWNSMITGYLRVGETELARELFNAMPERDLVSYNTMIDGYGKCGKIELAEDVFGMAVCKDVKSWTSMISAYVVNDRPRQALDMFHKMLSLKVRPDGPALVTALSAIANLGFLEEGKWVHNYIATNKVDTSNGFVGSALIDMYAKCGEIESAYHVFRTISRYKNIGDWNSMISRLALHGLGNEALNVFNDMERLGVEPNEITFLGLLRACSHGGLVDEGQYCFVLMVGKYKIVPKVQHYGCLIDLFGRAGRLEEALGVLRDMPFEPDVLAWKAILSASVKHGNVSIGEKAALRAIELDPKDSSSYVMLSNIYAKTGRFSDVAKVRSAMMQRRVEKIPGCSSIRIGGKVCTFLAGQATKGKIATSEAVSAVRDLVLRMKSKGYEPDLSQVLLDVAEEEEREGLLGLHSEKMAVAVGLIKAQPNRAPIRIVKNLRVCGDCHSFMKVVSRVYGLRIVVRDQNRFHHFQDGLCSCNEYW